MHAAPFGMRSMVGVEAQVVAGTGQEQHKHSPAVTTFDPNGSWQEVRPEG
jgi:hypothetical protein